MNTHNLLTHFVVLSIIVVVIVLQDRSKLIAHDGTPSLDRLEKELEQADYRSATAAYRKLSTLAESENEPGRAASAIIERHNLRSRNWLTKVGNNEDLFKFRPNTSARVSLDEKLPPECFRYLFSLHGLRVLYINGVEVTDAHIAVLSHIPELDILDISGTQVTGSCLETLTLPLVSLHLTKSPITDDNMAKASFSTLMLLDVSNTPVSNRLLSDLKMTEIRELDITGTRIDSGGVQKIGRFVKLHTLRLDFDNLDLKSLAEIKKSSLRKLEVRCTDAQIQAAEALRDEFVREKAITFAITRSAIKQMK